jgi:hypothetical protein
MTKHEWEIMQELKIAVVDSVDMDAANFRLGEAVNAADALLTEVEQEGFASDETSEETETTEGTVGSICGKSSERIAATTDSGSIRIDLAKRAVATLIFCRTPIEVLEIISKEFAEYAEELHQNPRNTQEAEDLADNFEHVARRLDERFGLPVIRITEPNRTTLAERAMEGLEQGLPPISE